MDDRELRLVTDDGKEELATILFTHEHEGVKYVVFEFQESGEVSAAKYEEESDGEGRVLDIETDAEWEMLDDLLDEYYDSLEDSEESED